MLGKINFNISQNKYIGKREGKSVTAYESALGKRTDYLLSEQVIFSHREDDMTPENFREDLHAHDYYEITICAGGENMQYISDGQYIDVRPGTVILTKPMAVHLYRAKKNVHYDRYVIYFKPGLNIFCQKNIMDFLEKGNNSCAYFGNNTDTVECVKNMEQELSDIRNSYCASKALLHLCNLFVMLSNSSVAIDDKYKVLPDFICEIKQYIDEEFINIHSIADLTEKFFYSREYITRSFRTFFNTPIYDYILKRKVLHCCTLLNGGASVKKAAEDSGFNNMSSFTKVFRKFNGCTPSEYKAKQTVTK